MATEPETEAEAGLAIHLRILADAPTANHDLFLRYFEPLQAHIRAYTVRKQVFLRDGDIGALGDQAVVDAIEAYLRRPESFDPTRKTLAGYLKMSAEGDFLNRLSREINRQTIRDRVPHRDGEQANLVEFVRIDADSWNTVADEEADLVAEIEDNAAADELLAYARRCARTAEERIVMDLMITGERSVAVYATALGIAHLATKDQQSQVTTIKERLSKRLKRGYRGAGAV